MKILHETKYEVEDVLYILNRKSKYIHQFIVEAIYFSLSCSFGMKIKTAIYSGTMENETVELTEELLISGDGDYLVVGQMIEIGGDEVLCIESWVKEEAPHEYSRITEGEII